MEFNSDAFFSICAEDNEEITRKISEECDARIIWGGDKTINQIRKIPIKARTVDIPFPDRYSLCVINSNEIFKLDKIKLNSLVNKFFNDTYIFKKILNKELLLYREKRM